MSKMKAQFIRNRLGVAVSALAVAAACGAVPAGAQTFTVPTGFNTVTINANGTNTGTVVALNGGTASSYTSIEIGNGVTGWLVPSWAAATWAVGQNTALVMSPTNISTLNVCANPGLAYSSTSCLNKGPMLTVDQGGTLRLGGQQTNGSLVQGWGFESAIHSDGTVIFDYEGPPQSWGNPTDQLVGTNYFNGNIVLMDQAHPTFGLSWASATTQFGTNTNIILNGTSQLTLYQSAAAPLVMGGSLQGTGTLQLSSGTLVINGQNTSAIPFLGTLSVSPGNTVVIGDSSHTSAIYGDPGHPTTQILQIKGNTSGSPVLRGFGTVDATVQNIAGLVQPGYGSGALGNLTVAAYTQDNVGTLKVEVNPTSVAGLHVLNNATLAGTLNVTIDPGSYGTQIYNIVQVDGTMTGDFNSITTSSSVSGAIAAVTKSAHGYSVVTEVVQGAAAPAPVVNGHLVSANRLNNILMISSLYDQIAEDSPRNGAQIGRNKYVWLEGFGDHASIARNDVGYHTTTAGFRAGAEYRTEANYVVGLAASYSSETLQAKGTSSADIDTWHVAAYGGANVQYMRLDGALFYNGYSSDLKRDFSAQSAGVAASSLSGYAYGGSIQASLPLYRGLVTPYIRGIWSRQHLDGGTEAGSTLLDLSYKAINGNTFVGDLGFKIDPLRSYPDSKNKLLVTVAVERDFSPLGEWVKGKFPAVTGQDWQVYWRGDSENTGIASIDYARQITDRLEIAGRVTGRFSLFQTAGELALNARYKF